MAATPYLRVLRTWEKWGVGSAFVPNQDIRVGMYKRAFKVPGCMQDSIAAPLFSPWAPLPVIQSQLEGLACSQQD